MPSFGKCGLAVRLAVRLAVLNVLRKLYIPLRNYKSHTGFDRPVPSNIGHCLRCCADGEVLPLIQRRPERRFGTFFSARGNTA